MRIYPKEEKTVHGAPEYRVLENTGGLPIVQGGKITGVTSVHSDLVNMDRTDALFFAKVVKNFIEEARLEADLAVMETLTPTEWQNELSHGAHG
jgi:hypothetical protein